MLDQFLKNIPDKYTNVSKFKLIDNSNIVITLLNSFINNNDCTNNVGHLIDSCNK